MSKTAIIPTKIGNTIVDIEYLALSPKELTVLIKPKMDTGIIGDKEDYMKQVSSWFVPDLAKHDLRDDDYKSIYYSILKIHPTAEYERLEYWRERDFDPGEAYSYKEERITTSKRALKVERKYAYRKKSGLSAAQTLRALDLETLKAQLKEEVIGQDRAVDSVFDWFYLIAGGAVADRSNLFCGYLMGPSGVGKTSFVETFAQLSGIPYKHFSGSEYQESYDAKRFLGSAPGLVGYDEEGGPLQKFAAENSNGIILFDEADKMHHSIWTALTNFLDKGLLQDGKGREIQFNGLIFFTSNIGFSYYDSKAEIGFDDNKGSDVTEERRLQKLIEKEMPYEIIGRLNDFFPFRQLEKSDMFEILEKTVERKNKSLTGGSVKLCRTAIEYIVEKSFDSRTGARNLHHYYEKTILLPFIRESIGRDSELRMFVSADRDKLVFDEITA
jgi:ATP-dependent Clp protease ATP-binding subunit ClpA